jgi:hypothetical protein
MEAYETKTIPELEKEIKLFEKYYLTEAEKRIIQNKNVDYLFEGIFYLTNDLKSDLEECLNLFNPPVVDNHQLIQIRAYQYYKLLDSYIEIARKIDSLLTKRVKTILKED